MSNVVKPRHCVPTKLNDFTETKDVTNSLEQLAGARSVEPSTGPDIVRRLS